MADLQLPYFAVMAENVDQLSHNIRRMQNIPAFDAGVNIIQAITALPRRMEDRFNEGSRRLDETNRRLNENTRRLDEINRRLDSMEFNTIARLANCYAIHPITPLSPLRDSQNQDVAGFPLGGAVIDTLNGNEINALLNAYGLPVTGNVALRKHRFKRFIGLIAME